jgi:hypothetical protein
MNKTSAILESLGFGCGHTELVTGYAILMRQVLLILAFFSATQLMGQKQTENRLWTNPPFITVVLKDTTPDKKVVVVEIGQKATIYLKELTVHQNILKKINDFNRIRLSKIVNFLDSASLVSDTILVDKYFNDFDNVVSEELRNGNARVFYKRSKSFVPAISHRLERYGMHAYRFFYLPGKRPFFAAMELTGILDDNRYLDDNEMKRLDLKLSGLRTE